MEIGEHYMTHTGKVHNKDTYYQRNYYGKL